MYRGAESGLATSIYYIKHAAHRLVQHTPQVEEIARTDDSTLAAYFSCAMDGLHRTVVISVSEEIGVK